MGVSYAAKLVNVRTRRNIAWIMKILPVVVPFKLSNNMRVHISIISFS
jgi:hypothetical protein